MQPPRPLSQLSTVPELDGILCDIDDTLTWEGRLVPESLIWLRKAQEAGLRVVPVTGRPAGWADQIARLWPVDGVVGENGGLWFWMSPEGLRRGYAQDPETRKDNRTRLTRLEHHILSSVPGTGLASDQAYRELDLAIDFCEDVPALPRSSVDAIVREFEEAGATCKVSSIHVNGWYGDFDKLAGFRELHRTLWGGDPDPRRWAFFGDSANDGPMFGHFDLSIGVANVRHFLDRLDTPPRWITTENGGHGFVEGLRHLLTPDGTLQGKR